MPFYEAFKIFKKFFKDKTGDEWDMRLEKSEKDEEVFVYTPPILSRPIGLVPEGYIRPEIREPEPEPEVVGSPNSGVEEDVAYDTDSEVDEEEDHGSNDVTEEARSEPRIYSESRMEYEMTTPIPPSSQPLVPYHAWTCVG
jgi:hypothetical protein